MHLHTTGASARRLTTAAPQPWAPLGDVALLSMLAVLLEAGLDVLPDDPVWWVLTPVRLVILLGVVCGVLHLRVTTPRPPRLVSLLHASVLVLALTALATTVRTGHDPSLLRGLLTGVGAYLLAAVVARGRADFWPSVVLPVMGVVAVASGVALRQVVLEQKTGFCRSSLLAVDESCTAVGAVVRATGTFANPNLLAAFLAVLLPLCVLGAVSLPAGTARVLGLGMVALGYVALLLTMSRAGLLAGVVGLVALAVLHRPTTRMVTGAGVFAVGFVTVAALAVVLAGGSLRRGGLWSAAAEAVRANPLGYGLGRAGAVVSERIPGSQVYAHAHNTWLDWLLDAGLPGLLAICLVSVAVLLLILRLARRGSQAAVALGAGLAAFAVTGLADDPTQASRFALLLWLVLGWVVGVGDPRRAERLRRARHGRAQASATPES